MKFLGWLLPLSAHRWPGSARCIIHCRFIMIFSGYSDMAIGLGAMFGFTFPENFHYPYLSPQCQRILAALAYEPFWVVQGISLYSPGRQPKGKAAHTAEPIYCIFLATGLWHGANWQFVAWGIWYAILLILERTLLEKPLRKAPAWFGWLYTMFFVVCGWVLFRAPGLRAACSGCEPCGHRLPEAQLIP